MMRTAVLLPLLLAMACGPKSEPTEVPATPATPTAEVPSVEAPAVPVDVAEDPSTPDAPDAPDAPDTPETSANPDGAVDGGACTVASDCQSGICEGIGCGDDPAGVCQPVSRSCTRDLRPYCGCDGATFRSSGSCPGRRFEAKGMCEGDALKMPDPAE